MFMIWNYIKELKKRLTYQDPLEVAEKGLIEIKIDLNI